MGKQRIVELKSVGNCVAKTVLVESANQFSLEELCRTQYSLKYFFRSHVDHQTYGKTLTPRSHRMDWSTDKLGNNEGVVTVTGVTIEWSCNFIFPVD